MREGIYLGFDFGYKRIGVAVGQRLTGHATPLTTLDMRSSQKTWVAIQKLIHVWRPIALIVGLPTCIDDGELYTTAGARAFSRQLSKRFSLPIHLVDERLSTVEARARLFEEGGYSKIQRSDVDSIAACIILEQWLQHP